MKRRDFLKAGVTAAGAWVAWKGGFITPKGWAYQVSNGLQKFIQPLPRFVFDIPLAAADAATYTGVDYYEIQATMFRQQLHPNLPASGTRLYGYQQLGKTAQALGAPVLATKNKPVRIKFSSNLFECRRPAVHEET